MTCGLIVCLSDRPYEGRVKIPVQMWTGDIVEKQQEQGGGKLDQREKACFLSTSVLNSDHHGMDTSISIAG